MLADFLDGPEISGFGIPELIAVGGGAPAQLLLSAPASLTGSFLLVLLLAAVLFPLGKYLYSKITEHRIATRMAGSNHPAIPAMQYEDPQMPEPRLSEQRLPEQLEPGKSKRYKPARAAPLLKGLKVREQAVDTPRVDTPRVDAPRVDTPRVDAPRVDTLGASDPGAAGVLEGYNFYSQLDSLEED